MIFLFPLGAQIASTGNLDSSLLLWPEFERDVLSPLYPDGIGSGLAVFWREASPEQRQEILKLYKLYLENPTTAEELRVRAMRSMGNPTVLSPTLALIPSIWNLKGRDFYRVPHNTGDPDNHISVLQGALNFYFQGKNTIAEDGYIRPGGETLAALRTFRAEHGMIPVEKTLLDDEVLLALSVYWHLSLQKAGPPMLSPLRIENTMPPVSTTLFPEMTANSIIEGLNRLTGRDLSLNTNQLPDLAIMALQTALKTYQGPMRPFEITGRIQQSPSDPTMRALYRFQMDKGLPQGTLMTDDVIEQLARVMLGFLP